MRIIMPRRSSASCEPLDAGPLGQFEECLLGELKTVVASQAIRKPAQARATQARLPRLAARRAAVAAVGLSAAIAAGVVTVAAVRPAASPGSRYVLAADFLNHAAAAARAQDQDAAQPKAGQVFYFEQLQVTTYKPGAVLGWALNHGRPVRQCLVMWQPSPLTKATGVIFGNSQCTSGVPALPAGYRQAFSQVTDGSHWYPAPDSLPTTPVALWSALAAAAARGSTYWELPSLPSGQIVFALASRLLEAPIPGSLRAALYETIAQMPGVSLVQNATDAAGRHGTGILLQARPAGHGTFSMIILAPGTYKYLGWAAHSPDRDVHTADLSSGLVALPRA